VLSIPFREPTIDVNAYTINTGEQGASDIREVGRYLTYSTPFGYTVTADGSLNTIDDTPIIQAAYAERVSPIMSITNFTFNNSGTRIAHAILSSTEIQDRLLTNILSIMKQKGYEGLNVDFENVSPEDREPYNPFLQGTVDRMHPQGYHVSTALAPKVSGEQKGLLH
jgi:spore germination protein